MQVYIIRHADAGDRDAVRWPDDAERPLTDSGRTKFRRVARRVGGVVESKPHLLSSRFARAWETATILAEETGWPKPEECPELESGDNQAVIGILGKRLKDQAVALIGHEPQLSELISLLLIGDERGLNVDMKKGAVASVSLPSAEAAGRVAGILNWIITPKLVSA